MKLHMTGEVDKVNSSLQQYGLFSLSIIFPPKQWNINLHVSYILLHANFNYDRLKYFILHVTSYMKSYID